MSRYCQMNRPIKLSELSSVLSNESVLSVNSVSSSLICITAIQQTKSVAISINEETAQTTKNWKVEQDITINKYKADLETGPSLTQSNYH